MALRQQGGRTAELGEAASDFGGWEEGEMAETPSEPGVMQPEARLWSNVSCTSQSGRLDGNVGAMVCPAACPHGPPRRSEGP